MAMRWFRKEANLPTNDAQRGAPAAPSGAPAPHRSPEPASDGAETLQRSALPPAAKSQTEPRLPAPALSVRRDTTATSLPGQRGISPVGPPERSLSEATDASFGWQEGEHSNSGADAHGSLRGGASAPKSDSRASLHSGSEADDTDDAASMVSFVSSEAEVDNDAHHEFDAVAAMLHDEVFVANLIEGSEGRLTQEGRCVSIMLPLIDMNPLLRESAGLTAGLPLRLTLDFLQGSSRKSPKPTLSVRFGRPGGTCVETSTTRRNPQFVAGLQLVHALDKFLDGNWGRRGESFWQDICLLADQRLLNAGDHCLLCDDELNYPGFKPTVCEAPLCCYQMDSLGIGSNLEALTATPKVADLLLLTTSAAANEAVKRRPGCLPTTPSQATGEPMQASVLAKTLDALPSIRVLAEAVEDAKKPNAEGPTVKAFTLEARRALRWIFASNRAHITALDSNDRIPQVPSHEQFRIHTSTRAHARAFEALKAAHGSFYAFHGSPLHNWHNILRNNLKNLSGTAMMSSGAAHGSGIYLAEVAGTSLAYTGGTTNAAGWAASELGANPQILALCEVANSPKLVRGRSQGIIVSPDAACVTLRYLFVVDAHAEGMAALRAQSLQLQRYRNTTTIASMEPIADLPPERLLVTSDQYAWDIEEVVAMVQAKHGLFVNSYTQQSFAPSDVRAILDHKSGAGQVLRQLEAENAALRRQISASSLAFLRKTGVICKNDQSHDFAPSNAAITKLQGFLAQLPASERTALRLAPFSAVDSLTGETMRDTIDNAVTLALSASACIHRFGDFLSQLK